MPCFISSVTHSSFSFVVVQISPHLCWITAVWTKCFPAHDSVPSIAFSCVCWGLFPDGWGAVSQAWWALSLCPSPSLQVMPAGQPLEASPCWLWLWNIWVVFVFQWSRLLCKWKGANLIFLQFCGLVLKCCVLSGENWPTLMFALL